MNDLYVLRDGTADDVPFVLNSFLKRYREAVSPRLISDKQYYAFQHNVIQKILVGDNTRLLVACDPADHGQIFGYVLYELLTDTWTVCHFAYIKAPFRRYGVATALLKQALAGADKIHYSHRTELVKYLDKHNKAAFNPAYVWSLL